MIQRKVSAAEVRERKALLSMIKTDANIVEDFDKKHKNLDAFPRKAKLAFNPNATSAVTRNGKVSVSRTANVGKRGM